MKLGARSVEKSVLNMNTYNCILRFSFCLCLWSCRSFITMYFISTLIWISFRVDLILHNHSFVLCLCLFRRNKKFQIGLRISLYEPLVPVMEPIKVSSVTNAQNSAAVVVVVSAVEDLITWTLPRKDNKVKLCHWLTQQMMTTKSGR